MDSQENIDFSQLYPWISNEFFTRILRKNQSDATLIVHEYQLEAALAKGENFGSQILRAKILYCKSDGDESQRISLIIKAAIANNPQMDAFNAEMGWFEREIVIYQQIIPEVNKLLLSIGDVSQMTPK